MVMIAWVAVAYVVLGLVQTVWLSVRGGDWPEGIFQFLCVVLLWPLVTFFYVMD